MCSGNTGAGLAIAGAGQGVTKNSLVVGSNTFVNNTVWCWGSGTSGLPSSTHTPKGFYMSWCNSLSVHVLRQVTGASGTGAGFALNLMPSMRISDCVFDGNTASQNGAGMSVIGSGTTAFTATNLTCVP